MPRSCDPVTEWYAAVRTDLATRTGSPLLVTKRGQELADGLQVRVSNFGNWFGFHGFAWLERTGECSAMGSVSQEPAPECVKGALFKAGCVAPHPKRTCELRGKIPRGDRLG